MKIIPKIGKKVTYKNSSMTVLGIFPKCITVICPKTGKTLVINKKDLDKSFK